MGARARAKYGREQMISAAETEIQRADGRDGVASFPPARSRNPYQRLLYDQLALHGLPLTEAAPLTLGWLRRSRREIGVLHFHWPQSFWHSRRGPTSLRPLLSWLMLQLFRVRLRVARRLGYRLVWTIHQVLPHETTNRRLDLAGARVLARACHVLVAHDRATAASVRAELGRAAQDVQVVPHGSYVGVYPRGRRRDVVRADLGIRPGSFVFLCLGDIRAYKQVELLLEAFRALARPDTALIVAGTVVDEASGEAVRAAATADPRIVPMLEEVPVGRVAELYEAADAAVLPRSDGGTSGSLLLSLSLGVPVVAARTDVCAELLDGETAGWLFEPNDAASLRRTLDTAVSAPLVARMKRLAALKRAEGLRWSDTGARTAQLMRGSSPSGRLAAGGVEAGAVDVLLVCSAGGHLLELLALRDAWAGFGRAWVTLDRSDARSLLAGERVHFAHGPTNRNVKNLLRNLLVARRLVRTLRPRIVLTTGAGIAIPFAWMARLHGIRVVYVESLTRIEELSLSGRLIRPAAYRFYVQWPELAREVDASYAGSILSSR
jgi:glycosyltransferase involved in cell wall biosynthesis